MRASWVEEEARRVGAKSILDVGSLKGAISTALVEAGFDVTAVDMTGDVFKIEGVTPIQMRVTPENAHELPESDVILLLAVLHHMPEYLPVLEEVRRKARKAVIVEVPNPRERLRGAAQKDNLPVVYTEILSRKSHSLGRSPGVHQPEYERDMFVLPPLRTGTAFGGSGNHAESQRKWGDQFEEAIGYRPFEGSLNVKLDSPVNLVDPHYDLSPIPGRRYLLWNARLFGMPVHAMVPNLNHPGTLELLAPYKLRDKFGIEDGQQVAIEIVY
jgi:hypothetical protein